MLPRVTGIVLAAGGSRRLGQPKQLLRDSRGITLVEHAVHTLQQGGCESVVVVTGRDHEAVKAALAEFALDELAVTAVQNIDWESGLASSVRCGVHAVQALVRDHPFEGIVMATCDMPAVTAQHVAALIATSKDARIRVCTAYSVSDSIEPESAHSLGIPAFFSRADWDALQQLTGSRGAHSLLERPDTLSVFLRNGNFDIDTPADLARWKAGFLNHP